MKIENKLSQSSSGRLCGILKALGHPERLEIIRYLAHNGDKATVKSIYSALGLEQAVVSRQLGILKNNMVVSREPAGGLVFYRLNRNIPIVGGLLTCVLN